MLCSFSHACMHTYVYISFREQFESNMYTSCSLLLNSCNYLLLLETFFYINNHHIVFNFSEYNNERILLPSLPSIHLLFSLTHFTAFPSPCPYLEFTLGSNIVFSCQPFIGIFSQVFFLSCISFFFFELYKNTQQYPSFGVVWYFLMISFRLCITGQNITRVMFYPFQGIISGSTWCLCALLWWC